MFGLTSTEQSKADNAFLDRCLDGIAHGSRDALARLYAAVGGEVFGYALSVVKNYHEAQDIQQEVFLKIWRCAGQYRVGTRPRAWIFSVARSLAMSCLRKSSKISGEELPEIPYEDASPIERQTLRRLLEQLPDIDRQIVMLHAMGAKHRETATVMQMPLSTVLSRYSRAIKKLKKCLESEENA